MIIDSHVHFMSPNFVSQKYWDSWVRLSSLLSGRPREAIEKRLPEFWDETGELLIKDMDTAGIDQSWVSVIDFGLSEKVGEAKYSIEKSNRVCAEIARRSNNRLVAFFGIDPRREGAAELLERGVREWRMRGLKILPPTGFYPNDDNCYRLYKKAAELGIPVLVHTGPEAVPFYSKYCYPVYLDDVANDFPELIIILAHAGFCWWQEALHIASVKPNIYLDLSGWQGRTRRHPVEEFYMPLRIILDTIGSSRILFGSDWPGLRLFMGGTSKWLQFFKELPDITKEIGISFTEDEVAAILGGNASRLIQIGSEAKK